MSISSEHPDDSGRSDRVRELRDRAEICEITEPEQVRELLALARFVDGETLSLVDEALYSIGERHPRLLEPVVNELVAISESSDDALAYLGVRSLSQLAMTSPDVAALGGDSALTYLDADRPELQAAALSLLGSLGRELDGAENLDKRIISSATHDDERVREAAISAICRLALDGVHTDSETVASLLPRLEDESTLVSKRAYSCLLTLSVESPHLVPTPSTVIERLRQASVEWSSHHPTLEQAITQLELQIA